MSRIPDSWQLNIHDILSAFYPSNISVVNLLQSLHWGGLLNHKKRRYFWIVVSTLPSAFHITSFISRSQFFAIFFWEWIPQYPFPLLTAISIICLVDNGRHTFVRNLFGAGSSNEGIGLFSFSTSWTLITQGNPLIWPLQTRKCFFLYYTMDLVLNRCIELNSYRGFNCFQIILDEILMSNGHSRNGSWIYRSHVMLLRKRIQRP